MTNENNLKKRDYKKGLQKQPTDNQKHSKIVPNLNNNNNIKPVYTTTSVEKSTLEGVNRIKLAKNNNNQESGSKVNEWITVNSNNGVGKYSNSSSS